MTSLEMHYLFQVLANEIDSLSVRQFDPAEIDTLLTTAQQELINANVSGLNLGRQGLEEGIYRRSIISSLFTPFSINLISNLDQHTGIISDSIMHIVSCNANDKVCNVQVTVDLVNAGELNTLLRDEFRGPSTKWRRSLGIEIDKSLTIYYPNTLNIATGIAIRYPKPIRVDGYSDINGVPTIAQDSELSQFYHHKVVEKAVELAQKALKDQVGSQLTTNNQITQ